MRNAQDELPARKIFDTWLEAKVLVVRWRTHYNPVWPYGASGEVPTSPEAISP